MPRASPRDADTPKPRPRAALPALARLNGRITSAAGYVLAVVGLEVGAGAVGDAIHHAGEIADDAAEEIAQDLDADVAVRSERRRERSFHEQHVGRRLQPLESEWHLRLAGADAECRREHRVDVGVLYGQRAAGEVRDSHRTRNVAPVARGDTGAAVAPRNCRCTARRRRRARTCRRRAAERQSAACSHRSRIPAQSHPGRPRLAQPVEGSASRGRPALAARPAKRPATRRRADRGPHLNPQAKANPGPVRSVENRR